VKKKNSRTREEGHAHQSILESPALLRVVFAIRQMGRASQFRREALQSALVLSLETLGSTELPISPSERLTQLQSLLETHQSSASAPRQAEKLSPTLLL
jgi:hypothetical protein